MGDSDEEVPPEAAADTPEAPAAEAAAEAEEPADEPAAVDVPPVQVFSKLSSPSRLLFLCLFPPRTYC